MPLYTFYCRRPDGAALSFEAREHGSDAEALAAARHVLAAHASCDRVEVYESDRLVGEARG
jgi:hypothetical protein